MARTPLAARIRIDPSYSDGYDDDYLGGLGGQNMSLAELRSPIEQMARTPQHIQFAESEPDQPSVPVVSRTTQGTELETRQMVSMQLMEEQIRRLQDEIQEIRRKKWSKWRQTRSQDGFKWAHSSRGTTEDSAPRYEFTAYR